jgi:ribosome-binding factor A
MTRRLERVRELLKREVGETIRRELPVNEAGLISVNDVSVSADLQHATIYVSILGGTEQQKRGVVLLQERRKLIQAAIARSVILKYTPQLRFVVDDSIARGNRVLQILNELENTSPAPAHETPPENH